MKCETLACAALLAAVVVPSVRASEYVIAADRATLAEEAWKDVVDALKAKHRAEVLVYDGNDKLEAILPGLRKSKPKYVCFVSKPENAGRAFVVNAAQLLRKIDDDLYGDALWGIVTGYDAADALRLAKTPKAREIGRIGTSMGSAGGLAGWKAGLGSDESNRNRVWLKKEGGEVQEIATGGNPAKALAEAFNAQPIDYFTTSGHATEHDWQIVFNQNAGSLRHDDAGNLRFMNPQGETYPIKNTSPKIYLAAGNCLIGHIDKRACMATSWLHSGGAEQFCGYTCVTFFGFMGWGIKSQLEEARCSFAEAYYLQNQMLLWVLAQKKDDASYAKIPLAPEDFGNGRRVQAFIQAHQKELVEAKKRGVDLLGFLWDRDIVAFYGDPAERWTYPDSRKTLRVTVKGADVELKFLREMSFGSLDDVKSGRPVITLLDKPPAGTKLLDAEGKPVPLAVVNDRFLLIPVTGKHAAGETLRYRLAR